MPVGFARSLLGGSSVPPRTASTTSTWSRAGSFSFDTTSGKFNNCYRFDAGYTVQAGFYVDIQTGVGGTGKPGTIEFWMRTATVNANQSYVGFGSSSVLSSNGFPDDTIIYSQDNNNFIFRKSSSTVATFSNPTTFTHIAFTTSGNNSWTLYANGSSAGTFTHSDTVTQMAFGKGRSTGQSNEPLLIDEFRASKIVRYTSGFTPPSAQFTNDSDTLALFHCEGGGETDDIS
jgi:hypothetical protein